MITQPAAGCRHHSTPASTHSQEYLLYRRPLLARPPRREHDQQVSEVHGAATVEVLGSACVPPRFEHGEYVAEVDRAAAVVWAHSGRELFYRGGGNLMVVEVLPGATFVTGERRALF